MRELNFDLHNYSDKINTVYRRTAVRGIVCCGGKYLLIRSKYGDCKFPGGGMEEGETHLEALAREIQEETGFILLPESVQEFLLIHEKRKGQPEDLMEMDSFYFRCDVEEIPGARELDDYEKEYDYQVIWLTLEKAIAQNEEVKENEKIPWAAREAAAMRELLNEV